MAVRYDQYIYSAGVHYIANSGSDEGKGYSGGRAGDQTGLEWVLKRWYNRPWTAILRYPDQTVALTIAKLSIDAALNDRIGYDQSQRDTYWKALQKAGYDPSGISTACEADCTAGVSANVRAAGCLHGIRALQSLPLCTSRNMKEQFTGAGFTALTASKYLTGGDHLLPGDILLCEGHHAAANITCGGAVLSRWHPGDGQSMPAPAEAQPPFALAVGSVHVRKGPDATYDSMGTLAPGSRLHWFGHTAPNGWLLVEYQRATGWVSGKYARAENA